MENGRRTDKEVYRKYRPSRFIKDGGKWYFSTREGTLEGPYQLQTDAESGLAAYIGLMATGFMPRDSKLSVEQLAALDVLETSPLH